MVGLRLGGTIKKYTIILKQNVLLPLCQKCLSWAFGPVSLEGRCCLLFVEFSPGFFPSGPW